MPAADCHSYSGTACRLKRFKVLGWTPDMSNRLQLLVPVRTVWQASFSPLTASVEY